MSPAQGYAVPAQPLEVETEVKKSRFIARAACVTNREQAMAMVAQARRDYPDARHVCWAYLVGNPKAASNAAMNDDGEPGGTAGKPILNVIQHKGIGDVMVVVIRYFGGIKLGAGGLTRAYSGAAEAVLSQLPLMQQVVRESAVVVCAFSQEQLLRHWAGQHEAEVGDTEYAQQVTVQLLLPVEQLDTLRAFCAANAMIIRE